MINLKNDKLDNVDVIGNHDNIHLISTQHAHLSVKIEVTFNPIFIPNFLCYYYILIEYFTSSFCDCNGYS